MRIFHYDPLTREFLGEGRADPSPLEPNSFLIPANATEIPPPPVQKKEVAVFKNGGWEVLPDFRGEVVYRVEDGRFVKIEDVGPLPETVTETPPPTEFHEWKDGDWVLNLGKAQAKMWGKIKGERDRRKAGGVKIGDKWFHSDDGSRIQQMGLVMMGASLPAGLQWKTMDGSLITMTPALAQQIFTGQAASDQAIFAVAEHHRAAMEASADPASYDYSTGWPKIFGE